MKLRLSTFLPLISPMSLSVAHAGPAVDVVFRNAGTEQADLKIVTSNESSTYQIANPKPLQVVPPGVAHQFRV